MNNKISLKGRLVAAVLALVMLVTSLLGTTFAWFTDSATSGSNVITAGRLDVNMYWSDTLLAVNSIEWKHADGVDLDVFSHENWEPGYTEVKYVKIANEGSLDLKWQLSLEVEDEIGKLAEVIDVYYVNPATSEVTSLSGLTTAGTLDKVISSHKSTSGTLLEEDGQDSVIIAIAMHMQESAGNEYQAESVSGIAGFKLHLVATQYSSESDSFGSDYDKDATFPTNNPTGSVSVSLEGKDTDADGKLDSALSVEMPNGIKATFPAGTKYTDGADKIVVSVDDMATSSNILVENGEEVRSIDVHAEGVSEDNTVPAVFSIPKTMPVGLNIGNYRLYHVEDGNANQMNSTATPTDHNDFYYDPATGDMTVAMATYSEVALVAEPSKWEGNFDYSWYVGAVAPVDGEAVTEYTIANADQLAAFGAIVGGMNGQTKDSFEGKTVKLLADVNLGDEESENNPNLIFYPIGYYNSTGSYEKTSGGSVTSSVSSFEGTFDGNGNTIANFYQNTWEMFGDYNDGYSGTPNHYKDAMGLFGYVLNGTVKNLTVSNFSSDGEFTPTGVIAAYSDGNSTFENIAITNCNPRVYNTGNGGIIGIAGDTSAANDDHITLKNITVDNSNKISALWGSWDVACGGIVGQYYPTSGQTSAGTPKNAGIDLINCHVSAQMDVYNDVCANYQYYAYRYTGMLIGSVRENETIDGHVYPKMDGITAKGCTVHFGDWNDYYYCEIIDNTTASYTHDYQMSRLNEIKAIDGTTITYLDGTTGTVPASGRANYVIVDYTKGHGTENATCYHFKDGAVWNHEDGGKETINGVEVLKEDKQHIYLEFNNLVTGYGWGVTSRGFANLDGVTNLDIAQGDQEASVEKFEAIGNINTYRPGQPIRVGDLFTAKDGVTISGTSVFVSVSAVVEGEIVSATFALNAEDWSNSTITFSSDSVAKAKVTITDYIFCNPTEIVLTKENEAPKFTDNSVGDKDAYTQITLGDLFDAIDGAEIGDVIATVTSPDGTTTINATNSDWATKKIDLNKSGSWTISIKDNDDYCTETAVTFDVKDINKFSANTVGAQNAYTQITLGDLFNKIVDDAKIGTVTATVVDPNNAITTITSTSDKWANEAITLIKDGEWTVKITDNASCVEAGVTFTVNKVDKFAKTFTNTNFTYRIGNVNEVAFSSLFTDLSPAISAVNRKVTVAKVNGSASATINADSITFAGNGKITVTVSADGTNDVTVTLEVVDAYNATGAQSTYVEDNSGKVTFANNVVLLNDAEFASLNVSNGYVFYGNGFTITCYKDSAALNTGYEFVALNNSIIDNVQIVCPNFDYAVLYSSNMTESGNRSETTDKTRYFNVKSAVEVNGNSQILNSYISGGRAAVNVVGGNCVIDNSRIEGGAVASLLIGAANSVTLRDVTLVQKPTESTYKPSETLMGFSVLSVCDSEGNSTPITIEGTLVQNAWVDENDKKYVPSAGQSIISTVLGKTDYLHDIDGDGIKESLNLGFAYMPESLTSKVNATTINDNRINEGGIPYDYTEVPILNGKTYVYSYKNTNGTADSFKTESSYDPNKYSDIITVNYDDASAGLETGKSFGTDGWVYELNVDLDKLSGYKLDFSKLSMSINGVVVYDFKVNDGAKPTTPVAVTAGGVTYTLTTTIEDKEYTATYKVTGTETSKESPSLVGTPSYGTGFGVANSYNGDWSAAAPVLEGITIRYWSVAGSEYKEFDLSSITFAKTGKQNGSNSYWEYTHTNNDFTLKLTNTVAIHDKSQTFGIPVAGKDGKLYFTIASTGGFVGNGTSSRSITIKYEFTDNNGGDKLEFTNTWNIPQDETKQYNYNSFVNDGTLTPLEDTGGGSCVTPDTLVTLADGTQKRIDQVTYTDKLLAWDFFKGEYAVVPSALIVNHGYGDQTIIELTFADGTTVKAITAHSFFDADTNKWELIDATNAYAYIGHEFVKANGDGYAAAKLVNVEVYEEYTESYSLVSACHYNFITEGMFSLTNSVHHMMAGLVVGENMTYDKDILNRDLAEYGEYTYADFEDYISYEQYVAFNGDYLKISVEKGCITFDDILGLINEYLK